MIISVSQSIAAPHANEARQFLADVLHRYNSQPPLTVNGISFREENHMVTALFTQLSGSQGNQTTDSGSLTDIEGLNFTLPAASDAYNNALITLNVPAPYAIGGTENGISYGIDLNGSMVGYGEFSNGTSQNGRSPFALQILVKLTPNATQFVQAQWRALRGGTGNLGGSASLAAIFVKI